MSFITEFVESPGYKKIMGKVYGWGAAVVLAGALFKIMHYPYAGPMLLVGMGTEIVIFFLSAFEPPHETPDWSLVYPELRGLESAMNRGGSGGGGSDLAALIESGNLDKEVVEKLSEGIKKLAMTTSQLSDVSDASLATESYTQNIMQAGDAVGKFSNVQMKTTKTLEETTGILADSYTSSASNIAEASKKVAETYTSSAQTVAQAGDRIAEDLTISGKSLVESVNGSGKQLLESYSKMSSAMTQHVESINNSSEDYTQRLSGVNKNLSAINATYELQLKGLNEQAQTTMELNSGLSTIKDHLSQSIDDSKAYKEQVAALSKTIGELNSIYGNMLSAMNTGSR